MKNALFLKKNNSFAVSSQESPREINSESLTKKQVFLKQKIQQQREEIESFKQEVRDLRKILVEKQQNIEDLKEQMKSLEKRKQELEDGLIKEIRNQRFLEQSNQKQREAILNQRNSFIGKKIPENTDRNQSEFDKIMVSSTQVYFDQKSSERDNVTLEKSPLLKKLKEKTENLERTIGEDLKNQENDPGYKEIAEVLRNQMEKTASLGYSGAWKKLKFIYGKMIIQGNKLANMEEEIKKTLNGTQNGVLSIDSGTEKGARISLLDSQLDLKNKSMIRKKHHVNPQKGTQTEESDPTIGLLVKIQSLLEYNENLTNESNELRKNFGYLQEELKENKQNSLKLEWELQDTLQKLTALQKEFNEKCQDNGFLEEKLGQRKEKINELRLQIENFNLKQETAAVSNFMENKNAEIERMSIKIEELNIHKQDLEAKLAQTQKQLQEYKDEFSFLNFSMKMEPRKSIKRLFSPNEPKKVSFALEGQEKSQFLSIDPKKTVFKGIFPESESHKRRGSAIELESHFSETEELQVGRSIKSGSVMLSQKETEQSEIKKHKKTMKKKVGHKELKEHKEQKNSENLILEKHAEKELGERKESREILIQIASDLTNVEILANEAKNNTETSNPNTTRSRSNSIKVVKTETQLASGPDEINGKNEKIGSHKQKKKSKLHSLTQDSENSLKPLSFEREKETTQKAELREIHPLKATKTDSQTQTSPILTENPSSSEFNKDSDNLKKGSKPLKKFSSFHHNQKIAEINLKSTEKSSVNHLRTFKKFNADSVKDPQKFGENTHQSSSKNQKRLNILLSNKTQEPSSNLGTFIKNQKEDEEKWKVFQSEALNGSLEKNEKTAFFTPKIFPQNLNKNQFTTSENRIQLLQNSPNPSKVLSFFSIPNMIQINMSQTLDKNPENLKKFNFLAPSSGSKGFKSKIPTISSERQASFHDSSAFKKTFLPDRTYTQPDFFPSLSSKNQNTVNHSINSFGRSEKGEKNQEKLGIAKEKIKNFFEEDQIRSSLYGKIENFEKESHRKNYSDHQLQLLSINFSKTKEKEVFSSNIPDNELLCAFDKLQENGKNKEILMEIQGFSFGKPLEYSIFRGFVREFERKHEKCGFFCAHLKRFLEKIGIKRDKRETLSLHRRDFS